MRAAAPFALLLTAAGSPSICPERPAASQNHPGQNDRSRTVVVFLGTDGQSMGVGTLIDRDKRLILTAIHVIEPEFAPQSLIQFRYAVDTTETFHRGHLVWKTALTQDSEEDSGQNWDKPRDIAIVQDDGPVPPGVLMADVAPDISSDEELTYSGVPEGGSVTEVSHGSIGMPVPSALEPGYHATTPRPSTQPTPLDAAQCTRSVARWTVSGMSGSAVLTAAGRVAGVTIAEAGPGQSARYVRLTCFFDGIAPQASAPAWLVNAIRTMDTVNLIKLLQHSPNDASEPVTNMALYAADEELRAEIESSSTTADRVRRNVHCALIPVAYARNLATDDWGPRWNREAADGLQQGIEKLDGEEKRQRARQAVGLFLKALQPGFLTDRIASDPTKRNFSGEELRTLSGLSDAAFVAADSEPSSPYMQISAKAASAIILSTGKSNPLIGKAYARFGEVAGLEGDYAGSARAYSEAQLAHYTPSWLWRAKADAVHLLDGNNAGGILTMNRVLDAANKPIQNFATALMRPIAR